MKILISAALKLFKCDMLLCDSNSYSLLPGNICISLAHLDFADMARSSSHSTDFLWDSRLGFEAAEGLSHSCCEATPVFIWQRVRVLLEQKCAGPTLRPLALRNLLSSRFACVWIPALFLWTSGQVFPFPLAKSEAAPSCCEVWMVLEG